MTLLEICPTPCGITWTDTLGVTGESPSLVALAASLSASHTMIWEMPSDDYDPRLTRWLRRMLAPYGHTLIAVPTASADVLRAAAAAGDPHDTPTGLATALLLGGNRLDLHLGERFDWHAVRAAVDAAHRAAINGAIPACAARAEAVMRPYHDLDESARTALGDGNSYSQPLLDAIWRAAVVSPNRSRFEQLLTLTNAPAHGATTHTVRNWFRGVTGLPGGSDTATLTLSSYRRALRGAYHQIHASRMQLGVTSVSCPG